jgi:WD40 repeat protein
MNWNRFLFCVAMVVCGCGGFAEAQNNAKYQQLEANRSASQLRSTPLTMSRYPTMFSIAVSEQKQHARAVGIDGRVWQWSVLQPSDPIVLAETHSEPACARLSTEGSLLAYADQDGSVALMETDSRQIRFRDQTLSLRTVTLRFSPDSKTLAGVSAGGAIRLWDVNSGKLLRQLKTQSGAVQTIAFSPDGRKLAVASVSRGITIHEIAEHDDSGPLRGSVEIAGTEIVSRVTAFAFTPVGGELVVATADGSVQVHQLESNRDPITLETDPFAIWSIAFDPSGDRMAGGSSDGTVNVWNTESWKKIQSLKSHQASVSDLAFAADIGLVSAGLDGRLLFWMPELHSSAASAMIAGRSAPVWVSVYSPDGKKLFVGGQQKRFEIWDIENKKLLVSRAGQPTTRCAAFSADGKTLAVGGDDKKILLADADSGETRMVLTGHLGAISAVVFDDESRTLVSGCDRGFVKVWDTATGKEKASWKKHKQQIYCLTFSPNRKWLITGGGHWLTGDPGELIVWERTTGRVHARLKGHKLAVWTIVYTPDGKRFATSDSSGAVKIWNAKTFAEERTLQHETWVRALAMSPDGSTLAVGRGDGSIRLWDTSTWSYKGSYDGHTSFAYSAQYSPDGTTLATSGNDGSIRFWKH